MWIICINNAKLAYLWYNLGRQKQKLNYDF